MPRSSYMLCRCNTALHLKLLSLISFWHGAPQPLKHITPSSKHLLYLISFCLYLCTLFYLFDGGRWRHFVIFMTDTRWITLALKRNNILFTTHEGMEENGSIVKSGSPSSHSLQQFYYISFNIDCPHITHHATYHRKFWWGFCLVLCVSILLKNYRLLPCVVKKKTIYRLWQNFCCYFLPHSSDIDITPHVFSDGPIMKDGFGLVPFPTTTPGSGRKDNMTELSAEIIDSETSTYPALSNDVYLKNFHWKKNNFIDDYIFWYPVVDTYIFCCARHCACVVLTKLCFPWPPPHHSCSPKLAPL